MDTTRETDMLKRRGKREKAWGKGRKAEPKIWMDVHSGT